VDAQRAVAEPRGKVSVMATMVLSLTGGCGCDYGDQSKSEPASLLPVPAIIIDDQNDQISKTIKFIVVSQITTMEDNINNV
jgi:hypothetical protein